MPRYQPFLRPLMRAIQCGDKAAAWIECERLGQDPRRVVAIMGKWERN